MNHRELDRLLCERLGIAPYLPSRHSYHSHDGNVSPCACGATLAESRPPGEKCPIRFDLYPALSTTGEGMLALMEVLHADPDAWLMVEINPQRAGGYNAAVFLGPPEARGSAKDASATLALALAAAAALGIEVPE